MTIPIILINLDKDVKRLQNAIQQLSAITEQPIYRYSAINGKNINLSEIPISPYTRYLIDNPISRCSHQQLNSLGGVGCYLSHYNVWDLYKNTTSGIYIFEDDLKLCPDFKDKLEMIQIPKDCDVLSFGYLGLLENAKLKKEGVTKGDAFFFGLQGYYVSPQGMKKLIAHAFPIEVHVDAYISLLAKLNIINLYFTEKTMVTQSQTTSSNITSDYCYKCLLPNVSLNTLIYIGIGIVLFLIIITTCIKIKKRKN